MSERQAKTIAQVISEAAERRARVLAGDVSWGGWTYEPSIFVLNHRTGYQVNLLHLHTSARVMEWIWHISAKTGRFSNEDVGAFVRAIDEIGDIDSYEGFSRPLFQVLSQDSILFPLPDPIPISSCKGRSGVYAIRAGDAVKIGRANDIAARRSELQTGNPQTLEVLAVLSKRPDHERIWHDKFSHLRLPNGEWFRLCEQIAVHIRDSRDGDDLSEGNLERWSFCG